VTLEYEREHRAALPLQATSQGVETAEPMRRIIEIIKNNIKEQLV
jgi:hypothetical protein